MTYQNDGEPRSLDDKAYDLFGELLLGRETAALLSAIEEEKAAQSTDADAFAARCDAKNLEAIHRYFHRQHVRTFFCKTLPGIGRVAAIVIAVLTIAGGIAVASSHTIRVQVMKLLTTVEEEYTELSLVEDTEASFDIPAEWEGEYYPAYIPEDMVVNTLFSWPGNSFVEYRNSAAGIMEINFSECDSSTVTNVDTENAITRDVMVNGNNGFLSIKDNRIIICWDNGRVYFILVTADFDEATALKIAESVTRVK